MVELTAFYLIMGAATVYLIDKILSTVEPFATNLITNGQRIITAILWPIILIFLIMNFIWGWISGMNDRK
jgi:hypothetical protein